MPSPKVRQWTPPAVLAVGCSLLLVSSRQQAVPLVQPLATLPSSIAGYAGKDIEISEAEQAIAGMSTYIMRVFDDPAGRGFSVYVGYYESQTQGKSIHSPKNCLPGAGWEPISAGTTTIALASGPVEVNRYVLEKESHRALVYYWYQGRGQIAANEYRVKWNLLRDKAARGRSEEALVRIVVPVSGMAAAAADSLASSVAATLMPQIESRLPPYPGRTTVKH
jgi:EpsI family protein